MVDSYGKYIFNNLMGHKQAGTANVLPAVLATWQNLLNFKGNNTQYDLYKQQAADYIDTARRNAALIKSKGEVALRNLVYKDKLERGEDLATVGGNKGNMTGSNLDVVMQKEKIRKLDEATVRANYTNQAMLEVSNGYAQAYNVYGTLASKAKADKWGVLASIVKGFEVYTQLQTRDAKVQSSLDAARNRSINEAKAETVRQNETYVYPRTKETEVEINLGFGNIEQGTTETTSVLNNSIRDENGDTIIFK